MFNDKPMTMSRVVRVTWDEWFSIQREKARQRGYYFVEELGYWRDSDREVFFRRHHQLRILYIHGLSSSGASSTAETLRESLYDDVVFSPDLPIDPCEALAMLQELVYRERIDLVIGTSMGGMFAQKLRGYHKILINPSFHVSRSMRRKLGSNEFFAPRKDRATHYEITEELCDRYEALERDQFVDISDAEREITLGLFATDDDVVDCSEEYCEHYTRYQNFEGGHRLSQDNIHLDLIPAIEHFRAKSVRLEIAQRPTIIEQIRARLAKERS